MVYYPSNSQRSVANKDPMITLIEAQGRLLKLRARYSLMTEKRDAVAKLIADAEDRVAELGGTVMARRNASESSAEPMDRNAMPSWLIESWTD